MTTWNVRSRTLVAVAAATALALGPDAVDGAVQEGVVGDWEGSLETPNGALRILFHITAADDGTLSGTWDSPDQGANGIPATGVEFDGTTLTFAMANVGASFTGTLGVDGTLKGTFAQGGAELPLTLERTEAPSRPERPQEPEKPYPYRSVDVRVENPDAGVTLAGTLTVPDGPGPFPGAVLVSGSGPQNRDEELLGHRPFLVLSDHLTRQGIAVLRYDDRGVGESTGDFAAATSEDFTGDALAALTYLRGRPEVRADAVGIVGHSEGGLIAPLAASRSDAVAYVVLLAGPGVTGLEILQLQGALINRAAGAPEEVVEINVEVQARMAEIVAAEPDAEAAEPLLREVLEGARDRLPPSMRPEGGAAEQAIATQIRQANSPWFRFFMHYDPRPALERVRVPVLALNGEKDLQVDARQNLPEIEAALARAANPDVTARALPGLNHLFQTAETGAPTEYATITETMSPIALEAVSGWIVERFGSGS